MQKKSTILGISASPADQGFCLLRDGELISSAQGNVFSLDFLHSCLKNGGVSLADIDLLAMCDRPASQWERILGNSLSQIPKGVGLFVEEMLPWLKCRAWMKKTFGAKSPFQGETLLVGRHESLAAEAFFQSGYQNAAFLTMDRGIERGTSSWGLGESNRLSLQAMQYFPHSLDLFCLAFMGLVGLGHEDREQFMELAAGGEPEFKDLLLAECMDLKEDGSFRLEMNCFDYRNGFSLSEAKGAALFSRPGDGMRRSGRKEINLASSVQAVMEEVLSRTLRHLHRASGQTCLCMIDNGACNGLDRDAIAAMSGFEALHVQDAAGGATGAALFVWHHVLEGQEA